MNAKPLNATTGDVQHFWICCFCAVLGRQQYTTFSPAMEALLLDTWWDIPSYLPGLEFLRSQSHEVVLSVLSQLRFALNAFVAQVRLILSLFQFESVLTSLTQTPRTTGSIKLQGSLEDMLIPLIHVYTSDFRLYPLLIMILPVLVSPRGRPTFLWESVRSIVCAGNVPLQADKMAFSLSGDIPNPDHTWALYLIAFRYQSLIAQPHNHILQETVALLLEILLANGPDRTTDYEW